jgi:hypothetical protein
VDVDCRCCGGAAGLFPDLICMVTAHECSLPLQRVTITMTTSSQPSSPTASVFSVGCMCYCIQLIARAILLC